MSIDVMNIHTEAFFPMFCIEPHCNYQHVMIADRYSQLFEVDGGCAGVPASASSWGALKALYR